MQRKILVTGADGFIGSHLTETLVRLGFNVKAFVMYNSFNSWGWLDQAPNDIKGHFEVHSGDIRDSDSLDSAVQGCSHFIHLAALIAIPYSYQAPLSYIQTNILGTLNALQLARKHELTRFIHTSTSEVYGTAQYVPITEKHPIQGQSPYAASKIGADELVRAFNLSFAMPTVTIRPFNTYGPRQSARAVIPTIITQLANRETTLRLGAISPTRDFNYVQDTVNGYVKALTSDTALGQTINLGSNYEISIKDTAMTIASLMGREIEILTDSRRVRPQDSEVERLWADNQLARELLDWQPEFPGLEGFKKGLLQTIDWFTDPSNLRSYKHERYSL